MKQISIVCVCLVETILPKPYLLFFFFFRKRLNNSSWSDQSSESISSRSRMKSNFAESNRDLQVVQIRPEIRSSESSFLYSSPGIREHAETRRIKYTFVGSRE